MGVIETLGSEQEGAEFAVIHAVALAWLHLRSADVLGGVGRDAPVDVREPVVAAHCRQSPVDRRGGQAAVLHPAAVELDVGSRRGQHGQADIGRPLEEATKIVAIGVKGSAAVASKERSRSQLRLIERTVRVQPLKETSLSSRSWSWWNLLMVGGPGNTSPWTRRSVAFLDVGFAEHYGTVSRSHSCPRRPSPLAPGCVITRHPNRSRRD